MDGFIDFFLSDEQNIFLPIDDSFAHSHNFHTHCSDSCSHYPIKQELISETRQETGSESSCDCSHQHLHQHESDHSYNPMKYLDFSVKPAATEETFKPETNLSFPKLAPTEFLRYPHWIKEEPIKQEVTEAHSIKLESVETYFASKDTEKEKKVKKLHKCSYCSKTFSSKSGLKSHVKIHTRVPNSYVCKFEGCKKKYSTSEGLRLHIRNHHTFDKKFVCPDENCGKRFVRQSDLRLHYLRMHAKERPFPCTFDGCSKSFACKSELRRHLQSHLRKRKRKSTKEKGTKQRKV